MTKHNETFTPCPTQFLKLNYDLEDVKKLYPVIVDQTMLTNPIFTWTAIELQLYSKMSA